MTISLERVGFAEDVCQSTDLHDALHGWGRVVNVNGTTRFHEDYEDAPASEMFAAAGRIVRSVDVPVTVDAEAGYGMGPDEVVATLHEIGAAGCNLEDIDHTTDVVNDADEYAAWLRGVRDAATKRDYDLVINARIDVFVPPYIAGAGPEAYTELVPEAVRRAHLYLEAGADCVYPILLSAADDLRRFIAEVDAPVNVAALPEAPSPAELAALGVARVSWAHVLHLDAMAHFGEQLTALRN